VTFTATVIAADGTPTGTVTFRNGSTNLGTGTLTASGTATLTTTALSAGTHSITAVYSGDAIFSTSTSAVLTQTVNPVNNQPGATATAVASSANPAVFGQSVTFTATVTATSGTPTGTVTFLDGSTTLGSAPLTKGVATLTPPSLSVGSHTLTAVFSGD